jgi:hypothetical protein
MHRKKESTMLANVARWGHLVLLAGSALTTFNLLRQLI